MFGQWRSGVAVAGVVGEGPHTRLVHSMYRTARRSRCPNRSFLCKKAAPNRTFTCMETTYPFAIKNQQKAQNALGWFFMAKKAQNALSCSNTMKIFQHYEAFDQ